MRNVAPLCLSSVVLSCAFLTGLPVRAQLAPAQLAPDQLLMAPTPRQQQASPAKLPAASAAGRLVSPAADLRPMTRLSGHLPGWVRAASDAGALPDATALHLDIMLQRPQPQQAAFDQLLSDQQNPHSPLYHAWLTPAQIGQAYGPAQADVDVLTAWLSAQGLQVDEVVPSRVFVRVSAPAGIVARAFATSFRSYTLSGAAGARTLHAATGEPAIPAAFAALVQTIGGLSDVPDEPQHRMQPVQAERLDSPADKPQFTSSSSGNHYVAPGDFAILYDVPAAVGPTNDGTGQKVAIIGRSQVLPADITNYLTAVGLATRVPNVVVPPLGADPGFAGGGDQGEATLDVQRVLGTAPGAQADLVISSNASGGLRTAIQYNVQTLLDPVMTISFGACEANAGLANVNLYTGLFSQAAAEGISVFVSAGDSGAAGCDAHGSAPPATTQIASINYICSSGFNTCVGGTEFNEGSNPAQYWSVNNTASRTSALAYIPEGVWNEPTTGATPVVYVIGAGGGGVSTYTAKPAFQAGVGVPADGFRDTPDVSFTSAGHDPYFGCYTASGATCVRDPVTGLFYYAGFYGTSAAAPSMAAVAALLNQRLASAQGNLNPLLYRLAATPANGVFNDATVASSGVSNCSASVPSLCNNSTPSPTALTGGLAGYVLTTGYDLASGWGSLDVSKFFTTAGSAGIATSTTLSGSSGAIPPGQGLSFTATIKAASGNGTPSGTVQFYANGNPLGAPAALGAGGVASLSTGNTLAVGTDLVTAIYSGDATYASSNSSALTLIVTAGNVASMTGFTAAPNPTTSTQTTPLMITVAPASGSSPVPTGSVNLYQLVGTTPVLASTATLVNGRASFNFTFGTGNFVFYAAYLGDGTYAPSISPNVTIISSAGASAIALSGTTSLPAGSPLSVTATLTSLPVFAVTSSVTFLDGTTPLATLPVSKQLGPLSATVTFTGLAALSNGVHSITASFAGDRNAQPSVSAPLLVYVGVPAGLTVTPASTSLSFAAGAGQGNTDVLTLASVGGYAGSVAVGCSVTYTGTGSVTFAPTCSVSSGTVTLASQGTATTTLSISTTLPHARPGGVQALLHGPAGMVLAMLVFLPLAGRGRRKIGLLAAALIAASLLGLSGCGGGGGGSSSPPTPVGTTKGSYMINVTSSGTGNATVTTMVSIGLTVQ